MKLFYAKFLVIGCILLATLNFSSAYAKDLIVGMLLAGSHNDNSYNSFHLDAALNAADKLQNIKIIYIEHANPIIRPSDVTIPAMVDDLVQKGASIIIANTYEMELGITAIAHNYPNVTFIQINGNHALTQSAHPNIVNVALMFEYAQTLAGFSAGMATNSGKIAYLAGSRNNDSFRQISAAYLGAKYAWETVRGMNPKDFRFRLKWMGNWFDNLSPQEDTKASALRLFNEGSDTIIGANDNIDIFTAAATVYDNGKKLLVTATANPYIVQNTDSFIVGISYYDWLPVYLDLFSKAQQGSLSANWIRLSPDVANLNAYGKSNVGFVPYDGLDVNGKNELDKFVKLLANGSINLFKGPLNYRDGTVFIEAGQIPSANLLLNMQQLLEGIEEIPSANFSDPFHN